MVKYFMVLLLTALLVAGCARKDAEAPTAGGASAPAAQSDEAVKQAIAYDHTLTLDAGADKVAAIYKTVESLCQQASVEQCVVLDSRLDGGDRPSARIKLRASRAGIRQLIERIGAEGKVVEQSITGEDLAAPINDSEKRLAILKDYRSRLEALGSKSGAELELLMRLNRELAEVQQQIESLMGENANLRRRVATETLTVNVYATGRSSVWRPIGDALGDFSSNLSETLAVLITAVAVLLPWLILTALVVWGVRSWLARAKRRTMSQQSRVEPG